MVEKTEYFKYKQSKVMYYMDSISKELRKFPPSLQISVTDYCAEKCYMCDHWKRENRVHMPFDKLILFLNKAKANGLETVCYSGGDPLMYRHVNELMEWHINNDVEYGFITTGSVPIKKLDFSLLKGATFIRCSIDAITPEIYKKIRGVNASEYSHKVVIQMLEAGCKVGLGITLSKYNIGEIQKLVDFALMHEIPEFRMWPIRHPIDGVNAIEKKQYDLAVASLIDAKIILNKKGVSNNLDETLNIILHGEQNPNFSFCKASLYQLFVDPSGKVFPCCIIAGDTEKEHMGEHLFTVDEFINESIDETHAKIKRWSDTKVDNFCKVNCTKRLSTINEAFEQFSDKKHFF